jgi:hypothetical protein
MITLQETEAITQIAHSNADQRANCVANRTAAEDDEEEEEEEMKKTIKQLQRKINNCRGTLKQTTTHTTWSQ